MAVMPITALLLVEYTLSGKTHDPLVMKLPYYQPTIRKPDPTDLTTGHSFFGLGTVHLVGPRNIDKPNIVMSLHCHM